MIKHGISRTAVVQRIQSREQSSSRFVQETSNSDVEHVIEAIRNPCQLSCNSFNGSGKMSTGRNPCSDDVIIEKSRENMGSRWSAKQFVKRNYFYEAQEKIEGTSVKVNKQNTNLSMTKPIEVMINGVSFKDDDFAVHTAGHIFML